MKGIVLTVLLSLVLVFAMSAVSCDNGAAPDIGDKEVDEQVMDNMQSKKGHPGGVLGGKTKEIDLGTVFKDLPPEP